VRQAFSYFSKTMWRQIKTFAYNRAIENLRIEISELDNSGILGAAALHYDLTE
jgi:glucokinase